jgi:hypothetical protein
MLGALQGGEVGVGGLAKGKVTGGCGEAADRSHGLDVISLVAPGGWSHSRGNLITVVTPFPGVTIPLVRGNEPLPLITSPESSRN